MTPTTPLSRRRLLTSGALVLGASLAGCTDDESSGADGPTGTTGATASPADLNLREANVVGVSGTPRDGDYRFDVTLHHDDAGEDGYANWWQVERLDGTRLGRRDLSHPHDEQPFTRSETIGVPEGVDCVVVRGHDQTHGYGGQAMVVTLDSGDTRAVAQGSDLRSFADADCP